MITKKRSRSGEGFGRGWRLCLVTVAAMLFGSLVPETAYAETRSLKIYFIHTKERAEIVYKRNGRYVQSGLVQINRLLRDWRRNEPARMDPRLLDLVWSVYRSVGARDYIHVVSGYRSPATNKMLRSRSSGVAKQSQHMLGKAIDFYIPGVPLSRLRAAAFKAEGGGVGYYPKSGAPFVHLDVGNVRSWPRMSRRELLALFPDGKTIHLPADGKPLPRYEQALAAYKARRQGGAEIAVASAAKSSRGGLFGQLFGGGADEEEDAGEAIAVAAAARPTPAAPAKAGKAAARTPEVFVAALPERAAPLPQAAPRPRVRETGLAALALAEPPVAAVPELVALNVPRPTPRPDYSPAANIPLPSPAGVLMASAATPDSLIVGTVHEPESARPAATLAAYAPMSTGSVGHRETAGIARDTRDDPLAAMRGTKTQGKSHKPTSADSRPYRESRQVPVLQTFAHRALSSQSMIANGAGTKAPSFAENIVRAAPRMIYTGGFLPDARELDASRFSGKAVEFLPMVRFAAN